MTARIATSDGLAPVVDDLAVDHEVDVHPAAHLARTAQDAFLTHPEPLRDGPAPQVVDTGSQLRPVQSFALVPAGHQGLRRPGHEPATHERLIEPEPQLSDVVGELGFWLDEAFVG